MLPRILEQFTASAAISFDIEDRFARDRKTRGRHPRPTGRSRFWLIGPFKGANRPESVAPWELVTQTNSGGYHLFFDRAIPPGGAIAQRIDFPQARYVITFPSEQPRRTILPGGADARRIQFPAGDYAVIITSDFYQQSERDDIHIPMRDAVTGAPTGPYAFTLEAGYAYPFPTTFPVRPSEVGRCAASPVIGQGGPTLLRGSLYTPDGRGIAGATVEANGKSYFTDSSGQWLLTFDDNQPTGLVTVHIDKPDNETIDVPDVCVIHGCETSLPETALRGWVQKSRVGVPGARVQVSGQSDPVMTGNDGGWAYYLDPNQPQTKVDVTATLPSGSRLTFRNVQVQPRSTVLVPTFQFS